MISTVFYKRNLNYQKTLKKIHLISLKLGKINLDPRINESVHHTALNLKTVNQHDSSAKLLATASLLKKANLRTLQTSDTRNPYKDMAKYTALLLKTAQK